jgi:hypothetical protein
MHEHQGTDASQDIYSLVQLCLKTGQDSGLADNSLKELKRYLNGGICVGFAGRPFVI